MSTQCGKSLAVEQGARGGGGPLVVGALSHGTTDTMDNPALQAYMYSV